jgi:HemY protein
VRVLFWFLLLAAAAVGVALAARLMAGYALFVSPPYRLELSLNLFLLLALAGFVGGYLLVRVTGRALHLPDEVRAFRRRQQQERTRIKQDAAIVALLEGRYGKARQNAEEALAIPGSSGLAALIAARAAIETRDFDVAESLLARPDAEVASLAVPRLMLEAETKLELGQPAEALARLAALRKEAGPHTAALRLELRALRAAHRFGDMPPLVGELVKRKEYGAEEADLIRAAAHAQELEECAHDPARLRSYWARLPEPEQRIPRIALAAARSFVAHGSEHEAAEIAARSLERHWDAKLVLLFAACRAGESARQIEQAESWLKDHNQDPALLHALGVLCARAELWGKAQTYFEASLALGASWRTEVALAELLVKLQRHDEANAHLAAALKLAVAELERSG